MQSPFWINSYRYYFPECASLILTFACLQELNPESKRCALRSEYQLDKIPNNAKQCWRLHDSVSQNAQLAGARVHHGNLPPMPPTFFASAEISRLRLSRPSQRSQEPSLGSEKLIGIGFAESECSEKLGALRIWVSHETCRAAVHWCVQCRKSLWSSSNLRAAVESDKERGLKVEILGKIIFTRLHSDSHTLCNSTLDWLLYNH